MAEVSAARTAICAVRSSQELCLYSDSKWCVDILNNLRSYKHRGWMAKGKNPVYHHNVWEEVYQLLECRTAPVSMAHVYGHNRIMYNDAVDALAKAGAAKSKVHKIVRPKVAPDDAPPGKKAKADES